MLKTLAEKLELKENGTMKEAIGKGLAEGAFVGCAVVGAVYIVGNVVKLVKN